MLCVLDSFAVDWVTRFRIIGTHVDYHYARELPVLRPNLHDTATSLGLKLGAGTTVSAPEWLHRKTPSPWRRCWGLSAAERLQAKVHADCVVAHASGLSLDHVTRILWQCDWADVHDASDLSATGFWRVDKDKDPELRHTVLTLVAFHDLEEKIRACGGDCDAGIEAFLGQNEGEGWMLPETLRLADYGLGHDERAKHPQPVASRLGPRFYDWQLVQSAEESWRECHLHARNLLGEQGYRELLDEIAARERGEEPGHVEEAPASLLDEGRQGALW